MGIHLYLTSLYLQVKSVLLREDCRRTDALFKKMPAPLSGTNTLYSI